MSKPTAVLADLKKSIPKRATDKYRVRVGMATCGISAGADAVFDAFNDAIRQRGLKSVEVIPTGCVGRCGLEPMAEVTRGDEPPVLYVLLNPEKVERIVEEHLVGGNPVMEYSD